MATDHNTDRLYLEMMREAVMLGDRMLIKMVLKRIGRLSGSSVPGVPSNVIAFPVARPEQVMDGEAQPKLWMTVLQTAMIPLAILLFLAAFHYVALFFSLPCHG